MAESFLEDIYSKAFILQSLREYVEYTCMGRERDARREYNLATAKLEKLLPELGKEDPQLAEDIVCAAEEIRDHYDDLGHAMAVVEGTLIPSIFRLTAYFADIDVEEGKYKLYSANSAFLTIRDMESELTLHSEHDPLWESYRIARSIYDPMLECYHIFGVGLGYLPYQLWRLSEESVTIVIYEEDETMLSYAHAYGVLDWIDKEAIEIICMADKAELVKAFRRGISWHVGKYYISPWKKQEYKEVMNGELLILEANAALERSMQNRTVENLRKNKKHLQVSFMQIRDSFSWKEWVIVSAGPSLDEQIEFLRQSKGVRGIIAVNTVLKRLVKENVLPDLVVAADQYIQLREHIAEIGEFTEGIPMIAERRVNWHFADQYRGPICFVSIEKNSDKNTNEEFWEVSGSVAALALEAAIRLGAEKVYLVGQDLAYPEEKAYAGGMPYFVDAKARCTMRVPSVDGGMVATSNAFNWFRQGLESQISRHPDISFINLSRHGALIKGCMPYGNGVNL